MAVLEFFDSLMSLFALNDTAPGSHRLRWVLVGVVPILILLVLWLLARRG